MNVLTTKKLTYELTEKGLAITVDTDSSALRLVLFDLLLNSCRPDSDNISLSTDGKNGIKILINNDVDPDRVIRIMSILNSQMTHSLYYSNKNESKES